MAKLGENGQWDTTYCGSKIVSSVGMDATGKSLDDIGTPETLKFWMDNLDKMLTDHHVYMEFYTLGFATKKDMHCSLLTLPIKTTGSNIPNIQLVYEMFTEKILMPDRLK
jgi:hypothetical protein